MVSMHYIITVVYFPFSDVVPPQWLTSTLHIMHLHCPIQHGQTKLTIGRATWPTEIGPSHGASPCHTSGLMVRCFTMPYWWADTLVHWIRMDCGKRALCSKVAMALRLNDCGRAAAVAIWSEVHATGCHGIKAEWLQQGSCRSNAARGACHRVATALRPNDCSRAATMELWQRTRVVAAAMWPKNHTLNWHLTMCQAHYNGVPLLHDSPRSMIIYRIRGPWRWCALFYYASAKHKKALSVP